MSGRSVEGVQGSALQHDERSNQLHAMAKKVQGFFPQVPLINCTELKRRLDDPSRAGSLVIVDVREPAECEVSMIPSSLTTAEFEEQKAELRGKTVVCYCTVGFRSSAYAAKLLRQGFEAKNLEGSIVRWAQKRYPLVTRSGSAEQETKRIHVYGKQWALAPEDYEAVVFEHGWLRRVLPRWLGGKK